MSILSSALGIIVGLFILVTLWKSIKIVRPLERGLIERFGKYNRFANPGINFVLPYIENIYRIDITENMCDAGAQEIITKDKLNAQVDAQVYYKVKPLEESCKSAIYNVANYQYQIVALARTTLRNIIGTMSLTEANSERNKINGDLLTTLDKETKDWGIEVVRTELKEISPPANVQETMNRVVQAENEKIAAVDFATSVETKADGAKRAIIKEAEGKAQQIEIEAKAQAEAIKLVNEAAEKYFIGNAQILKRLQVTEASLKDNSKIVITEKGIQPSIILGDGNIIPITKKKV